MMILDFFELIIEHFVIQKSLIGVRYSLSTFSFLLSFVFLTCCAKLNAASKYTESFKVIKACKGVFVFILLDKHVSLSEASKLINDGYGLDRLKYV